MSFASLILQLLLALARLFAPGAGSAAQARADGASAQRAQEMSDENRRIAAAARAGLDAERLPAGPDPYDRDTAP